MPTHGDPIIYANKGHMNNVMEHGYLRKSIEDRVERTALIRNYNYQTKEAAKVNG